MKLCRCDTCQSWYQAHELDFILNPPPILDPEEDDDEDGHIDPDVDPISHLMTKRNSVIQKVLGSMDHVQAIEGVHALNRLSHDLTEYLKPFAETGKVVTKDDILHFFSQLPRKKLKWTTVQNQ